MDATSPLLCPSAQPDMENVQVFGVLQGAPGERRVAYLRRDVSLGLANLPDLGAVPPTHVFRLSATCETSRCAHYANGRCSLAQRVVDRLAPVVGTLPPCRIRPSCRWYAEHGAAACYRCPQVVTAMPQGDPTFAGVATAES